ncbi:hypothetical protein M654_011670 [Bacillus sp. NSP9.1]|nr:hypothetical protein M654_011670 [Bacillus sp. NSP9.1]
MNTLADPDRTKKLATQKVSKKVYSEEELEKLEKKYTVRSMLNCIGMYTLYFFDRLIVLLSGMFGEYDISKIKNVAVSLELIHMASLVHDDVIDDAELRRGQPTIKAKWDNRIAMYTGDYLFARSLESMTN